MEKKEFDEKAQMMTLEALIASLLIIAAVLFVVSQVPPQAQHGGSFSNVQLNHYGDDLLNVLKKSSSPAADYDNLIQYYIGENNYSELNVLMENSLPDNVGYSVSLVSGDDKELLFSNGYPVGEQVVVSEIVVSKNVGLGGIAGAPAEIRKVEKTFPAGSLIIPMDDNYQCDNNISDNYIPLLRGMGLIYNIANGTYSDGKPISVWQLLEDPRGEDYTYFDGDVYVNTSNNPRDISNGSNESKFYAGGPYIIDANDLTPEIKGRILNASEDSPVGVAYHINIHQTLETFYHYPVAEMRKAPRIAAYPPEGDHDSIFNDTIKKYYEHSGVPYSVIDDTMIQNRVLDDIDIITIPHANILEIKNETAQILIDWVSEGGVIHAGCEAISTLDQKVELIDQDKHPWYGFIGIDASNQIEGVMVFVGNSSLPGEDNTGSFGESADPGAVFHILAQSGSISGTLPFVNGSVHSFILRNSSNPDLMILAGVNETSKECCKPSVSGEEIIYVCAPFDQGFVIYLAGHDQSISCTDGGCCCGKGEECTPTPHRERLMFHTFFYPGFGKVYDYGVVELQITMWYK
ncbi:MAG: hypothetical protein MIO93_06595 [ANME-2 cluster archaeon]|nr:hypothetical protein [ANME-2 cluster archaeon]